MKLLLAVCALLFLKAAHVECRQYKLFVFGDSFADTGNYPLSDLTEQTRAWYYPYGSSDSDHGTSANGRFSNGLVLPDFLARTLGRDESPPPEREREKNGVDPSGMNFAVGSAAVLEGTHEAPKLGTQVDKFRRLVRHNIISKDLNHSVALIAFSGKRDYARVADMTNTEIQARAQDVTDKMAGAVEQLLELGVKKALVTTLPPLGCTPWLSKPNDYDSCDSHHKATTVHNAYLQEKVFQYENIFMLDLKTAFDDLVADHHDGSSRSKKSKYSLKPCCESFDEDGYCGQMKNGKAHYSLCSEPDKHFYWDEINPTQAGWKAVMKELDEGIKNFLDISS